MLTSWGTFTIKSWPKVSLVASRTSKATTATARKHPGHPVATLSRRFGSHGSVPCPHSLEQHSHSHLVLFSHIIIRVFFSATDSLGAFPSGGLVFQLLCSSHRYWAYGSKSTVWPKVESCFQDRACSVSSINII